MMVLPCMAESGIASVYQPGSIRWGGPKASNGERIDFNALTVAHHKAAWTGPMPFGTCLSIRYLGRSVVVRVVDNGPHTKGRVLDFTPGVAKALAFPGLGRVEFEKTPCPVKAADAAADAVAAARRPAIDP